MSKPTESLKAYWRSLDDHEALRAGVERPVSHDEFPGQELSTIKVGRRGFVGILGASTALAGLTTGCLRKPVERILPFAKRPEDLIPGEPVFYASAYQVGGSVLGVLVESQDGRPTKIEGNPKHSASQGATDGWTQAAVLNLYDPERTQAPMKRGDAGLVPAGDAETGAWQDAKAGVDAILAKTKGAGGQGVALVLPWTLSPTLRAQTQAFLKAYPKARVFLDDATAPVNAAAALEMLSDRGVRATYHLDTARVVVAVDSDFLATEQDHVRLAREFARLRSPLKPTDGMNRLYAVGPHFTVTGGAADHRLRLRGGQVGLFLIGLAQALAAAGVQMPAELVGVLKGADLGEQASKFTAALAKDLIAARAARGEGSAILVGERQPAWVHGLGLAINNALGNANNTLRLRHDDAALATEDLAALAAGLSGGAISTVLCLGTNPAHDAPGELKLAELLGKAEVVHVGSHVDETAALAAWHLPLSHALEGWGDLEASDGTISICQPLIRPLFDSKSAVEVLAWWASGSLSDDENSSLYLVQGTWRELLGTQFSERRCQWGMVIDLNACTGCSATCVVACVAENNIPMVGKIQVAQPRDVLDPPDRYFTRSPEEEGGHARRPRDHAEDPQVHNMPVPCMQCENAPCESVCPVAATTHSPDGLNDMVYNRCIGTRYCSNNCPYKVRRYNYLDYVGNVAGDEAHGVQPGRHRALPRRDGEVHLLRAAHQRRPHPGEARRQEGRRRRGDVRVTTACAQACPTQAITFGNIIDTTSKVAKLRASRPELRRAVRAEHQAAHDLPGPRPQPEPRAGLIR
jgi:Fe-S-cluster-containing dehydrogenase component